MAYQVLVCNVDNSHTLNCHYTVNEQSANELINAELDVFAFNKLTQAQTVERRVSNSEIVKPSEQLVQTYNVKGDDGSILIYQFIRPLHTFEGYYKIFHANYTKLVIKITEVDDKLVESVYQGDIDAVRT